MNQSEGLYTITKSCSTKLKVKSSEFLGFLFPCVSEPEFSECLSDIRSEHSTATHHCSAYRIQPQKPVEFSADDGEPSGTAGTPILNALKAFNAINCALIVVRYYGGTKLGKPGLIHTYGAVASQTLETANLKHIIPVSRYKITYNYSQQSIIDTLKHSFSLLELHSIYVETVTLTVACSQDQSIPFQKKLETYSHLFISVKKLSPSYHIP